MDAKPDLRVQVHDSRASSSAASSASTASGTATTTPGRSTNRQSFGTPSPVSRRHIFSRSASVSGGTPRRFSSGSSPQPTDRVLMQNTTGSAMHAVMGLKHSPKFMLDRLPHADDSTKLTSFPAPGHPNRRAVVQLKWDGEEDESSVKGEATSRKDRPRRSDTGVVPRAQAKSVDQKSHWMPDKMVKDCYGCGIRFTMFTRRHHCRVCGLIFCHSCSSPQVDARAFGISDPVRMCNACEKQRPYSKRPGRQLDGAPGSAAERDAKDGRFKRRRNPGDTGDDAAGGGGEAKKDRSSPTSGKGDFPEIRTLAEDEVGGAEGDNVLHDRFLAKLKRNVESPDVEEAARSALEQAAVVHLERMVRQLVAASSGIDASRQSEWSRIVTSLVQQAVSTVDPNVEGGDHLDIRPYVKTRLIPGGRRDECRCVDGIVFRKNVTHKSMPREIEQPRLLLLSGGIEFQHRKLANLDTLVDAENHYLTTLVGKIVAMKPSVLLVSKSINRVAQDLLLRQRISMVQNVKPIMMERIGRLVGARIIPSIDHIPAEVTDKGRAVAPPDRAEMGSCGRFRLLTFASPTLEDSVVQLKADRGAVAAVNGHVHSNGTVNGVVVRSPDHSSGTSSAAPGDAFSMIGGSSTTKTWSGDRIADGQSAEGRDATNYTNLKSWVPTEFRKQRGRGGVTYMCFEGCHRRLGCTLVLRGAGAEELKAVKRVAGLALNIAYNLRLEVSYLNDRRACLMPSCHPSAYPFLAGTPDGVVGVASATRDVPSVVAALSKNASFSVPSTADGTDGGDGKVALQTDGDSPTGTTGGDGGTKSPEAKNAAVCGAETLPEGTPEQAVPISGAPAGNAAPGAEATVAVGPASIAAVATAQAVGESNGEHSALGAGSVGSNATASGDSTDTGASTASGEADGRPIAVPQQQQQQQQKTGSRIVDDTQRVLDQPPMLSSSLGVTFGDAPPMSLWGAGENGGGAAMASKSTEISAVTGSGAKMESAGVGGKAGGRQLGSGGEHFAFQSQNLMITCVWMTRLGSQCCPANLKFIRYYTPQDVALGRFLMDNCFNPTHKCQNLNCKKSVREHVLSFIHNTGRVNITVGWAPFDLEDAALANADSQFDGDDDYLDDWTEPRTPPRKGSEAQAGTSAADGSAVDDAASEASVTSRPAPEFSNGAGLRLKSGGHRRGWTGRGGHGGGGTTAPPEGEKSDVGDMEAATAAAVAAAARGRALLSRIYMWSACKECGRFTTPFVPMSEDTWKFSLGKFLEVTYYNRSARARGNAGKGCEHRLLQDHILWFGYGKLLARFEYTEILPYKVFIRQSLPQEPSFYTRALDSLLRRVAMETSQLFRQFDSGLDKVLGMTEEPELQDLEGLPHVVQEASDVRTELASMGSELLEKMSRTPHVVSHLPAAQMVTDVFQEALQALLAPPQQLAVPPLLESHEEEDEDEDDEGTAAAVRLSPPPPQQKQPRQQQLPQQQLQRKEAADEVAKPTEKGNSGSSPAVAAADGVSGSGGISNGSDVSALPAGAVVTPVAGGATVPDDEAKSVAADSAEGGASKMSETSDQDTNGNGTAEPSVAGTVETTRECPPHSVVASGEDGAVETATTAGAETGLDKSSATGVEGVSEAAPAAADKGLEQMSPTTAVGEERVPLDAGPEAALNGTETAAAPAVESPQETAENASASALENPSVQPGVTAAAGAEGVPRADYASVAGVSIESTAEVEAAGALPPAKALNSATTREVQSSTVSAAPAVDADGAAPVPAVTRPLADVSTAKMVFLEESLPPGVVLSAKSSEESREETILEATTAAAAAAAKDAAATAAAAAEAAKVAANATPLWGGKAGRVTGAGAGDMLTYLTQFRRRVYWKASHWNDRLVATGQLLMALKKVSERRLSRSRSGRGGNIDRHSEDHIQKAIERLQQVKEGEIRPDGDDLTDQAEVLQAMDTMLDQVELTCEVSFALDGVIDGVEEQYEVYRAVEDLVETVDRRDEVDHVLEEILAATEKRADADTAAAVVAAEDAASRSRRPVSELRRLFASPGSTGGSTKGRLMSTPASERLPVESGRGALRSTASMRRAGTASTALSAPGTSGTETGRSSIIGRMASAGKMTIGSISSNVKILGGTPGTGIGGKAGGSGGAAGRSAGPKRATPSPAADGRRSPRRSSDPTPKLKSGPGWGGPSRPGDASGDGLSEVTRRRLRGLGSSSGGSGSSSPRASAAGEAPGLKRVTSGDMGSTNRRPRIVRQRSRSLSTSPSATSRGGSAEGVESPPVSPRSAVSLSGGLPVPALRGRLRRPPSLSDMSAKGDGVGSAWGIAGGGRARSGSPRAATPSSPPSPGHGAGSRSPSPQRAGGIPRPRGRGAGAGGSGIASPRTRRPSVEGRQGRSSVTAVGSPEFSSSGDGGGQADGGNGASGGGTLSMSAIESAATLSIQQSKGETGGKEGNHSSNADFQRAGTGDARVAVAAGPSETPANINDNGDAEAGSPSATAKSSTGAGGDSGEGIAPGRRSSRASSFDSVGDVVIVGGVALGNHSAFPWENPVRGTSSESQPSTPTTSSRARDKKLFEDAKGTSGNGGAADIAGSISGSVSGSVSGSAASSPSTMRRKGSPSHGGPSRKSLSALSLSSSSSSSAQARVSKARKPTPSFPTRMNIQSALARLLGGGSWGSDRKDWTVPLGPFAEGRPRLPPGRKGEFIPVFEDIPTTIIAYSLSSHEYHDTLQAFYRHRGATGLPNVGVGPATTSALADIQEDRQQLMSNASVSTTVTATPGSPHESSVLSQQIPTLSEPAAALGAGGIGIGGAGRLPASSLDSQSVTVDRDNARPANPQAAVGGDGIEDGGGGVGAGLPRNTTPLGGAAGLGASSSGRSGSSVIGGVGGGGTNNATVNTNAGAGSPGVGSKLDETWWVMIEDAPPPPATPAAGGAQSAVGGSGSGGGGGTGTSGAGGVGSAGGGAGGGIGGPADGSIASSSHRKKLSDGGGGDGDPVKARYCENGVGVTVVEGMGGVAGEDGARAANGAGISATAGAGAGVGVGAGTGVGGSGSAGSSPWAWGRGKGLGRRPLYETPEMSKLEAQMRSPAKSHVKHRFTDSDAKGNPTCKFICDSFWATQFKAVRRCYFVEQRGAGGVSTPDLDDDDAYDEMEQGYIRSLCMTIKWDAKGGKSGATFSKTADERFVVKFITKTELQMFLDCALNYFEFMSKAFFHKLPTVLCKIVGVYRIGFHNKVTGKKQIDQVVVMQNIFYQRNISLVFDLKGSTRSRYVRPEGQDAGPPTAASSRGNLTPPPSTSVAAAAAITAATVNAAAANASASAAASAANMARDIDPESPAGSAAAGVGAAAATVAGVSVAVATVATAAVTAAGAAGAGVAAAVSANGEGGNAVSDSGAANSSELKAEKGASGSAAQTAGGDATEAATVPKPVQVLLDENFMEFTRGQPLPMQDRGKALFQTAILNDTLFLNIINIVDYSIVVGLDEDSRELVVGIIDYMRQYDIIKRMERMGKSVSMIAGQAEPTIVQPSLYKARFQQAMDRYFMTVPDKWTSFANV